MDDQSRWMVGMDFSEGEEEIITYVDQLSHIYAPEKIYFVHVEENLEIPEEILEAYPEIQEPLDETLEEKLNKQVQQYFSNKEVEVECMVIEGEPLEQLLHTLHVKNIDLFIVRIKVTSLGSGVVPKKLARKANCSILFVPEGKKPVFDKILIPSDFSEHGELSMNAAQKIKNYNTDVKLHLVHIFDVPVGYYKTGKSYEEFSEIMKGHAEKAYNQFLKKLGINKETVHCTFIPKKEHDITKHIIREEENFNPDLTIMGSKGEGAAFHFLLGSIAEKLVSKDCDYPLMIVKFKNENLGLMEALLRI